MTPVSSSDDVVVAVHDLAGTADTAHPLVLVAHATGFHGRAYLPLAAALAPRLHTVALDFRGHGDTAAPPDWQVDWTRYGDDALAVARSLVDAPGARGGLVGFGHSKGGAALLMAVHRAPEAFRLLVLFEPIVFPPAGAGDEGPDGDRGPSALPIGARRRRATFPSIDDAITNYASKPPLQAFDPAALDAYVRFGFRDDPDSGGVRLKCEPEHEARTFEQGGVHRTWDLLPQIHLPVVVVAGRDGEGQPAAVAEPIADRLPAGRFVARAELDHFGPMTHPAEVAELITSAIDDLTATP